jgi:hypothetical protein
MHSAYNVKMQLITLR